MSPARHSAPRLADLAQACLDIAKRKGATAADVEVSTSVGLNVTVRLGEVETIEHNRDKGLGVTVYLGQKRGNASTTDLSTGAIERAVEAALAIARFTAEDACAGLPEPGRQAVAPFPACDLHHPWAVSTEEAIALGLAIERAGLAVDKRINNSEGASVSMSESDFIYANSNGFAGGYPTTRHSASCTLIAASKAGMQRDYWYSVARAKDDLEGAEVLGRKAGQRTVARLDARRVPTGDYPVLFEAPIASGLIGALVNAVSGTSLYRKASFLMDSLGTEVASTCLNVLEDPFLARGLASGPFDAEGVATVKRAWVKGGVLQGYFLGSYSARKLGMASTGNAGGNHNLIVQSTGEDFAALLKKMGRGLLVTELLGQGVNGVTGDYSRGAAGFWVEGGEIAYPVEEITIAGNMKDMLKGIVAIGSDTLMQGSKITGSILIDRMSVAGE
ncbi:MAG: metalloprotease PmbA [Betaproteobacteria bacterium]|nr:metalloprotease PmbA [Betaproteobacteria bacterium]